MATTAVCVLSEEDLAKRDSAKTVYLGSGLIISLK